MRRARLAACKREFDIGVRLIVMIFVVVPFGA
jgi:hypothetical protein